MNGTVSWAELTAIISIVATILAGAGAIVGWLWSKINGIYKHQNELRLEIADVRLKTAQEYVAVATLERVEERLSKAIDQLGDRLETMFRAFIHKED